MKLSILACTFALVLLAAAPAYAGDSVIVGGQHFTCTNTCVVTPKGAGAFSVRDCCGGKVTWKPQ